MTATGEAVSPGNARSLALLMLGTEESAHHRSRGEIARLPSSRAGARDSGREGDTRGSGQRPQGGRTWPHAGTEATSRTGSEGQPRAPRPAGASPCCLRLISHVADTAGRCRGGRLTRPAKPCAAGLQSTKARASKSARNGNCDETDAKIHLGGERRETERGKKAGGE